MTLTRFIIHHDRKIYRMDSRSDSKVPTYDETQVEVTERLSLGDENRKKKELKDKGYVRVDLKAFEQYEKK